MKVRAIRDLSQLNPADFFQAVSEGLELILQNADSLINDAQLLIKNDCETNSVWILRGIAEEEAAKFLILIDAVRCPKTHERFSKHLQNFNDHVAKGIYAEYYDWRPATFGEIIKLVEHYRAEYYLDGPEGVEWIFRNTIHQGREEIMYVDYIDDGERHRWQAPDVGMRGCKMYDCELERDVLEVSRGLKAIGCTRPEALSLLSEFWKDIEMEESTYWQTIQKLNVDFFEEMSRKGLLLNNPELKRFLINRWLSPIYSLDLSLKRVDKKELQQIQQRWNPEY